MAKKKVLTIDEAKTAIVNYSAMLDNAEKVIRSIGDFQTFLRNSYSDNETIIKFSEQFIDETHIDGLDFTYEQIDTFFSNVTSIGLPYGKYKLVPIFEEQEHKEYYIPLEYIVDPSTLDKIIAKYRKMIEDDIREFKKLNLDDVIAAIGREILENSFTLKDLTKKFNATAKFVCPKWDEFHIDVKDVSITKVCDKNIFTVVYVDKTKQYHTFVCAYCGDI